MQQKSAKFSFKYFRGYISQATQVSHSTVLRRVWKKNAYVSLTQSFVRKNSWRWMIACCMYEYWSFLKNIFIIFKGTLLTANYCVNTGIRN